MLEKIFVKIDNLSVTGKILLFSLLLVVSAVYVYLFAEIYGFYKLPKVQVASIIGVDKNGNLGFSLNAIEILNEVATNEVIFKEADPDKRRCLINLRDSAYKTKTKVYAKGLMYGIFSINLLWLPAIKFRKYRKAKKLEEEMDKKMGKIATGENCYNHSQDDAVAICRYCGRYFCSKCLFKGEDYYYCKNGDDCLAYQERNNI